MDVVEFGSKLVLSGDLDPIYTMLNTANLPEATLKRWLLAYWMFYHAGVSSLIANAKPKDFWRMVWRAQDEKWPRGTERRHFKAENSRKAIEYLQDRYEAPEFAVSHVSSGDVGELHRFKTILERAQQWVGFGPWIAFKIADMVDAVLHVPVDFHGTEESFFDDPVVGAILVANASTRNFKMVVAPGLVSNAKSEALSMSRADRAAVVRQAVAVLKGGPLGKLRSPTNPDRLLALQEYETIFCKYKSHLNGHYPPGKDTAEILMAVSNDRWGPLALKLSAGLQQATGWKVHHG